MGGTHSTIDMADAIGAAARQGGVSANV
jgi:hypothetical protein